MAAIHVDEADFPLIVVVYPPVVAPADLDEVFAEYARLARRGERLGWVIEFRRFNPVAASPALRKRASEAFERHRQELLKATVCEARVVTNMVARGVLTAFDWMTGTKWPCANFASQGDAVAWVRDCMRRDARSSVSAAARWRSPP